MPAFNFTSDPTAAQSGYNPAQYASRQTSNQLAEALGADVYQTRGAGAGSFGYKPQDVLFSQGSAQNSGLVADRLQRAFANGGQGEYENVLRNLQLETNQERAGNTSWQNEDSVFNLANQQGSFSRPDDGYRAPANSFINYGRAANMFQPQGGGAAPQAPQPIQTAVQPGVTPIPGGGGGWDQSMLPGAQGNYGPGSQGPQQAIPGMGRAAAPPASSFGPPPEQAQWSRPGAQMGGNQGGYSGMGQSFAPMRTSMSMRPGMNRGLGTSRLMQGMFRQRQPMMGGRGAANPMYSFSR